MELFIFVSAIICLLVFGITGIFTIFNFLMLYTFWGDLHIIKRMNRARRREAEARQMLDWINLDDSKEE